jgi:hypothetical protein
MLPRELIEVYKMEGLALKVFKEYRVKKGITCKKCGSKNHYWLASKYQFQCKDCRFRTTLRSGTVLEGSKLPYSYFFIAVHLLLKNDNILSIEEFQRQTGHKYFDPLSDFLRKIKNYVKQGEKGVLLIEFVEIVNQHFILYKEN